MPSRPPAHPVVPTAVPWGRAERMDDFGWLAGSGPDVLAALRAERAYYEERVAHLASLREELAVDMRSRLPARDRSVTRARGGYAYRTEYREGADLPILTRTALAGGPDEVLVDLAAVAAGAGSRYAEFGLAEPTADGRLLAWSVDLTGAETYTLRFRDLAAGRDLDDVVPGTYYTGAWDRDGTTFCYLVPDHAMRPWQVRAHRLGTPAQADRVLWQEDDERFDVQVRASRSGAWIVIDTRSRDTSESLLLPANDLAAAPVSVAGRVPGVEYTVDHAPWRAPDGPRDEVLMVTNRDAPEFRVLAGPVPPDPAAGWTEVVPHDPAVRVVSADAFGDHVVLSLRRDGLTLLRVVRRDWSSAIDLPPASEVATIALDRNDGFDVPEVTIRTQSRVEPTAWWDLDLSTGRRRLRHATQAPGLDPDRYAGTRVWATARDGERIPVSVLRRVDVPLDGTAPCLLYGYGAYEYVFEPEFDPALPALLDRGVVFAHAHVRGGGEMGRRWWLAGRMLAKRATFDDFVDVGAALAHDGELGLVDGDRIVTRGLSAGGLLQGAVYSQAPRRWRAVVAEVPFVDVVTAMSDASLPLTVNEWDEWGDPRDREYLAYLAGYSPYENPPPAADRPPLLVTGALHDPRVLVREPAKWVARLRLTDPDGGAGADPGDPTSRGTVLFRVETGEGAHHGPAGRFAHLDYEAEVYAWVLGAVAGSPDVPAGERAPR